MNKRIAKKKAKAALKQIKPLISAKELKALSKRKVLDSLKVPEQYQGKLTTRGEYWSAIKKYHDYMNKGLIRESSILDKYENADAFTENLSQGELKKLLQEGATKEAHIQAALEQKRARMEEEMHLIDF